MALFLGLLRRTHVLSRHSSSVASAWLGSIQPLCRGMRRCRGLVLGIIGRSLSARCLATRSLAFNISVLYFDLREVNGKSRRPLISFPSAARRMDTLNDLLAASDLVSLHCSLSNETMHLLNADRLQNIKPGAFIVNTSSSQLIDDCALKQLLIDGTIAGCALDGAEGPQWMESWVREMPNVLILPRSAGYSEEAWMEIREKAISQLVSFFCDGTIPKNAISDEDEGENENGYEEDNSEKQVKETPMLVSDTDQITEESQLSSEYRNKWSIRQKEPQSSGTTQNIVSRPEGRRSRSGKKGKKRPARRRSEPVDEFSAVTRDNNSTSPKDEDTAMSGRDQAPSSSSRFVSPEDSKNKQIFLDSALEKTISVSQGLNMKSGKLLKDGFVVALHARDRQGLYVSRRKVPEGSWFLDMMLNVTKMDPASQFLVSFVDKHCLGFRSFTAGGRLLQINSKMEFVFTSYNFDAWERWTLEGSLEECRLVNCRSPLVVLDVSIEILAASGEDDGVTRWLL